MTTTELLAALAQECPNGVSFDPMAVRLLRQKVPLEDGQIEDLKNAMFQVEGGIWLSLEMAIDDKDLFLLKNQSVGWLREYGYFSVERLFDTFRCSLPHIATPEARVALLRHLEFQVVKWGSAGHFCILPTLDLDDALLAASETIAKMIDEAGGTLIFHKIEQVISHLTADDLERVRVRFLPEIHRTELGGVSCWRSSEAIMLPEDFQEKLTAIVDTLNMINEKITIAKLEFALNLFYCTRFREEYALTDNDTFSSICAKYYQGESNIFQNTKKLRVNDNGVPVSSGRVRSQNTRFCNLGVSIGAKLVFIKDSKITCTVLDDINQVEYDGNAWSISSLAMHLLGGSSANGFCFFSYEGEVLWDRRLRLEQEGKQDEDQSAEISQPDEVQGSESGVIGLSGQVISASTWRAFRRDGSSPRVAEWARRVANGESVEQVARESGYAVPTMKGMISNHRLYFKVCKLNGIVPEGGTNV